MDYNISLTGNEELMFALRALYDAYGYTRYRMSKFEEYDLYSGNKDFLVSDGIITFTDTNGKLMALKPDVTLSIVKNTSGSGKRLQKLYYNENVYRISKSAHGFREIIQIGLECIGKTDDYCVYEVLRLAAESLKLIDESSVLDVSDIGMLECVLDYIGVPDAEKPEILRLVGEKNRHELLARCTALGISAENAALLCDIITVRGKPETALPKAEAYLRGIVDEKEWSRFSQLVRAVSREEERVYVDFSLSGDVNYYNGMIFKGFVDGVPNSVLSGGQYDTLMRKMKRTDNAIGFAVYLDMLEHLYKKNETFDVDVILVYNGKDRQDDIRQMADRLRADGSRVLVTDHLPDSIRYKRLVTTAESSEKEEKDDA